MEETYQQLAQRVIKLWTHKKAAGKKRIIILVAGPPGSGKSTIAKEVVERVSKAQNGPAIVNISADGFHLPLSTLRKLPNASEALEKRGAPWTFDAEGVVQLVRDLGHSAGRRDLEAPSFDHAAKDPVANGVRIPRTTQVCLVEGNYILTDQAPWDQIGGLANDRWLIRVGQDTALERIVRRHLDAGIETDPEGATWRARNNDLVNGEYVMRHSEGRYDILVESRAE